MKKVNRRKRRRTQSDDKTRMAFERNWCYSIYDSVNNHKMKANVGPKLITSVTANRNVLRIEYVATEHTAIIDFIY